MQGILNVLLIIHLIIAVLLIGLILLQKSEGGALGIGMGNIIGVSDLASELSNCTAVVSVSLSAIHHISSIPLCSLHLISSPPLLISMYIISSLLHSYFLYPLLLPSFLILPHLLPPLLLPLFSAPRCCLEATSV